MIKKDLVLLKYLNNIFEDKDVTTLIVNLKSKLNPFLKQDQLYINQSMRHFLTYPEQNNFYQAINKTEFEKLKIPLISLEEAVKNHKQKLNI